MSGSQYLAGRGAVVTGSNRGIGRAVALALAAEGAGVVVNGRDSATTDAVAEEILTRRGRAQACPGSVADFEFAGALVACCEESFGSLDVLVNCAGVSEPESSSILDITPDDWHRVVDVHLHGTFNTCRHAAPRMKARRTGTIVNTSSHSFLGSYGGTAYPAAKGAINSLTYALAAELREHGIRVNAVCPGARTRLSSGPKYEEHVRRLNARGLLADDMLEASLDPPDPEHVGPLYTFLASDLSDGITGRVFSASGGYVGLFVGDRENLLALRDHREGPWPLDSLSERLWAAVEF